jgi:hypothetical protein
MISEGEGGGQTTHMQLDKEMAADNYYSWVRAMTLVIMSHRVGGGGVLHGTLYCLNIYIYSSILQAHECRVHPQNVQLQDVQITKLPVYQTSSYRMSSYKTSLPVRRKIKSVQQCNSKIPACNLYNKYFLVQLNKFTISSNFLKQRMYRIVRISNKNLNAL